jgi:hypothetical protein
VSRPFAVCAVLLSILTGCSGEESSSASSARTTASDSADSIAANTPTDLKHPCDAVPGPTASKVLDELVTTTKVESELAPRTLHCRYVPAEHDLTAPSLEIRSTPDVRPLAALVGLYLGVDRLPHHPVDVRGADDAEAVLAPEDALVTIFAKQGFVTHTVVLGLEDADRAERIAVKLAGLVVAENR